MSSMRARRSLGRAAGSEGMPMRTLRSLFGLSSKGLSSTWTRSALRSSSTVMTTTASPSFSSPSFSSSTTSTSSSSCLRATGPSRRLYATNGGGAEEPPVAVNRSARRRYVRHPWNDSESVLTDDLRILTYLAGNTAAGNLSAVGRDWCYLDPSMHAAGMDIILQTVVFAGVPKVLNALQTVSELGVQSRHVLETSFPEGDEFKEKISYDEFTQRGEAEMHQAFCHKYSRLRERMSELHPALDRWMVDTVYGRLRSRPGLSSRERQLCALAALAGNVVWPQFKSSIIVALNSGCTLEEVRSVLDQTEKVWGRSAQIMVDALWTDLNKKSLHSWQDGSCDQHSHSHGTSKLVPAGTPIPPNNVSHNGYSTSDKHPFMYLNRMRDDIPQHLRILALLAAHTASGNLTRVGIDWSYLSEEYHQAGLEVILQTTIFGGFQKVINALQMVHNIGVSPKAINYEAEAAPEDRRENIKRGRDLLKLIYQKQYTRLREKMRYMHADAEKVIVEWAYGRVLSRPSSVLTPKERELCALACLSGQIVIPQLHSHILGALNAGARLEEIRAIFDQTEYVWGKEEQIMVDGFWLDFAQSYNYHKQQKVAAAKPTSPESTNDKVKLNGTLKPKDDAGSVMTG